MDSICESLCTACKACQSVCPVQCISEKRNNDGRIVLAVDNEKCINCNQCKRICPQITPADENYPKRAYAAWNRNVEECQNAASGGIASAACRYAVDKGWYFTGTYYDSTDYKVKFAVGSDIEDIERFKNSKYVHSDAAYVYKEVLSLLRNGATVIFIGLPCQVAGMKNVIKNRCRQGKVYYIDLVCHGTPPAEYLQKHICTTLNSSGKSAHICSFRDPEFDTSTFTFTLRKPNKELLYAKEVVSDDNYQYGFHRAILYRENCYSCRFAKAERCGDITLGDYKGLGSLSKYSGDRKNVSCILVNTENGAKLIDQLVSGGYINACERPVQEPIRADHQLNAPSVPHKKRTRFIQEYIEHQDFTVSALNAYKNDMVLERVLKRFNYYRVKAVLKKLSKDNVLRVLRERNNK